MIAVVDAVSTPEDLDAVKRLFRRYADWLEADHAIPPETHGIDAESAGPPAPQAPPDGALIGARAEDGRHVGCIALRRLDAATGEVKRLFVLPESRGVRVGARLIAALIARARTLGYARIALDVGDYQGPARALYGKCGFRETPPGDHIAYPAAIFMALAL